MACVAPPPSPESEWERATDSRLPRRDQEAVRADAPEATVDGTRASSIKEQLALDAETGAAQQMPQLAQPEEVYVEIVEAEVPLHPLVPEVAAREKRKQEAPRTHHRPAE